MREKRRALVLDTSAFIAGFDPSTINEEIYTVPEVGLELIDKTTSKIRFITGVESGRLMVVTPAPKYVDLVKTVSKEIGDLSVLSETDIQVLALAAQLEDSGYEVTVITDDYSMQNTAGKIGLKYASLTNLGIRYQFHWITYCPACGRRYPSNHEETVCQYCGTHLERKPRKRKSVKRDVK
ncbi:MAG: hypothetical protein QW424_05980 [Candidatus Bathyarchaeia archaeon]|nr:hypothetical protein [Candidatus Bathyarchaeota archaeon]